MRIVIQTNTGMTELPRARKQNPAYVFFKAAVEGVGGKQFDGFARVQIESKIRVVGIGYFAVARAAVLLVLKRDAKRGLIAVHDHSAGQFDIDRLQGI